MATIATGIYKKKGLPYIEQSKSGNRNSLLFFELNPPDKLIALLKENKYLLRVSGYASEDQWDGYKMEIVNLDIAEPEKGINFLLNDNNLYIKALPAAQGDTNVIFYVDSE
ncbi:MAG: hypothetical protein ABI772_13740 [Bacteroidota bacterium]